GGTGFGPALRLAGAGALEVGHVPQREQPHGDPHHAGPDPPPVARGDLLAQHQRHRQGDRPGHRADDGDLPVVRLQGRRGWPPGIRHGPRLTRAAARLVDEMFRLRVLLAKVMTQAKEDDTTAAAAAVRHRPGHRTPDLGEPAGEASPGRAAHARARRAGAVRYPAGRAGDAGTPRRDEPGGPGRAREGAAALHDPRHRRAGGLGARDAGAAPDGPAAGDTHRDAAGPQPGAEGPAAKGSVAGAQAGGAEPAGAGDPAGGRADPGEAEPVLTRRPRRSWLRTFASLGTRNYRLFVTGQVVSNTGTWMQRVAQDWLVLQLTHGSGTALGIATGLQFLPQLLFSLWGGMIADRYPKRR